MYHPYKNMQRKKNNNGKKPMLETLKVSYNGIHKDLATTWLLYHRAVFPSKPSSQKAPL